MLPKAIGQYCQRLTDRYREKRKKADFLSLRMTTKPFCA